MLAYVFCQTCKLPNEDWQMHTITNTGWNEEYEWTLTFSSKLPNFVLVLTYTTLNKTTYAGLT